MPANVLLCLRALHVLLLMQSLLSVAIVKKVVQRKTCCDCLGRRVLGSQNAVRSLLGTLVDLLLNSQCLTHAVPYRQYGIGIAAPTAITTSGACKRK